MISQGSYDDVGMLRMESAYAITQIWLNIFKIDEDGQGLFEDVTAAECFLFPIIWVGTRLLV